MPVLSTLLEVVGFLLVVAAAGYVAIPLALFVGGAGLIFVAQGLAPKPESKR